MIPFNVVGFFFKNTACQQQLATEGFQATSRDVSKSGLKQVVLLGGLSCLPGPLAVSSVKNNWKKRGKNFVGAGSSFLYGYICIYGSPPPRAHLRGRECVLNTFKDMLRKHCKFQCFMHILLVLF